MLRPRSVLHLCDGDLSSEERREKERKHIRSEKRIPKLCTYMKDELQELVRELSLRGIYKLLKIRETGLN